MHFQKIEEKKYTMKRVLLFVLVLICIYIVSCNNLNHKKQTDSSNAEEKVVYSNENEKNIQCYVFTSVKDIYTYKLVFKGNNVTGTATYDNFEKDDSKGRVEGTVYNNILHLWYNFEAEGMQSVSEYYFKISDTSIIQGTGEISVKGDTAYFTDADNVSYNTGLIFKKQDCE